MRGISDWLSDKVVAALRLSLESKHLYQGVVIDRNALQAEAAQLFADGVQSLDAVINEALDADWSPHDEISVQRPSYGGGELPPRIAFYLTAIKAACAECKAVTPFNLRDVLDVYGKRDRGWRPIEVVQGQQEFVFAFECQSCCKAPDVFLVRRRGLRLTLCGRSPMELVLVPKFIPKSVQKYYSSAVVAFQSGQVLAALFLLRVLIEQFTIEASGAGPGLRADDILDRYTNLLPEDFKTRFPSLKAIYSSLSAAIHAANEATDLFEDSREKIEKHFDARRVFEIE